MLERLKSHSLLFSITMTYFPGASTESFWTRFNTAVLAHCDRAGICFPGGVRDEFEQAVWTALVGGNKPRSSGAYKKLNESELNRFTFQNEALRSVSSKLQPAYTPGHHLIFIGEYFVHFTRTYSWYHVSAPPG